MAMLVAILSGIVTHKKILADFFLLRFGKGQRSWLDAHNASSVLFLPFILMITSPGLVSLSPHYLPLVIAATYAAAGKFFKAPAPCPLPGDNTWPAPPPPL